jgi:hypothetical protein
MDSPESKHHVVYIENNNVKEDVIDEVIFCSKHDKHIVETFCEACKEMLCKVFLKDHYQHSLQTIEQNLSKLVVDMDDCMESIKPNWLIHILW